jgi:hypothetical protein
MFHIHSISIYIYVGLDLIGSKWDKLLFFYKPVFLSKNGTVENFEIIVSEGREGKVWSQMCIVHREYLQSYWGMKTILKNVKQFHDMDSREKGSAVKWLS